MPHPRPLPSLRSGTYDDPPASFEASTPQSRRQRLRRAILGTSELAQEVINMASPERPGRRSTVGGLTRRRQRSSSEHDELSTGTPGSEGGRSRRSNKRRRLNSGMEAPAKKAIKYGYYGQVEPGKLKLELVSCDGGEHVDSRHPETSLAPENLLRHDKSVYCSERPEPNIILKHADDTPFCLEKLHIVGPEMGFTAPVRAGVVYVGMTMASLQKYIVPPHARRSRFSPHRRRMMREIETARSSPELLSIEEALRDPYINAAHTSQERDYGHESDGVHDLVHYDSGLDASVEADMYCDFNPATDPTNWQHNSRTDSFVRRTQPVTILSDEDAGPEESSPQEVLDYRFQRERTMRRRHDIENWHRSREAAARDRDRETSMLEDTLARIEARSRISPPSSGGEEDESERTPLAAEPARHREREPYIARPLPRFQQAIRRNGSPHPIHDVGAHDSVPSAPIPPPARPSEDKHVTTASFRLSAGKSRLAIAFSPPVSGRFILLKLWAREDEGNVDVQSVIAKGWMGAMRFFPAVEMK